MGTGTRAEDGWEYREEWENGYRNLVSAEYVDTDHVPHLRARVSGFVSGFRMRATGSVWAWTRGAGWAEIRTLKDDELGLHDVAISRDGWEGIARADTEGLLEYAAAFLSAQPQE